MAVLAGFGVVRFLKSSANASEDAAAGSHQTGAESFAGNAPNRSRTDNKGYRDEFTR
jgi:hypothetical protein